METGRRDLPSAAGFLRPLTGHRNANDLRRPGLPNPRQVRLPARFPGPGCPPPNCAPRIHGLDTIRRTSPDTNVRTDIPHAVLPSVRWQIPSFGPELADGPANGNCATPSASLREVFQTMLKDLAGASNPWRSNISRPPLRGERTESRTAFRTAPAETVPARKSDRGARNRVWENAALVAEMLALSVISSQSARAQDRATSTGSLLNEWPIRFGRAAGTRAMDAVATRLQEAALKRNDCRKQVFRGFVSARPLGVGGRPCETDGNRAAGQCAAAGIRVTDPVGCTSCEWFPSHCGR